MMSTTKIFSRNALAWFARVRTCLLRNGTGPRLVRTLIAQELEAVGLNHFVKDTTDDPNNLKSVSYMEFVPILIQAVKELSARVAALEGV